MGLVHDLPIATSVTTEPVTADDWEIVVSTSLSHLPPSSLVLTPTQELHASYVEQNLLSQVRVAFVGQEVDVWVFGRTRARLLVSQSSWNQRATHSFVQHADANTQLPSSRLQSPRRPCYRQIPRSLLRQRAASRLRKPRPSTRMSEVVWT